MFRDSRVSDSVEPQTELSQLSSETRNRWVNSAVEPKPSDPTSCFSRSIAKVGSDG